MASVRSTCWHLIEGAAAGVNGDRDEFVRRYRPVVAAYLGARWKSPTLAQQIDDATQEVFVECFRQQGALTRAEADRSGGFRAYFYGVVLNVARRQEAAAAVARSRVDAAMRLDMLADDDESPSLAFDRAWARAILRDAADLQREVAQCAGDGAERRVELLQLHFGDGVPLREIAQRWHVDAAHVHREYARARREFERALRTTVAINNPGSTANLRKQCAAILAFVS